MSRFDNNDGTSVDVERDIQYSTRYDDKELIKGTEQQQLDWLTVKLNREITYSSDSLAKLERLEERYWSDCNASNADENMAYYQRYMRAWERVTNLINSWFNAMPRVKF